MKVLLAMLAVLFLAACHKPAAVVAPMDANPASTPTATAAPTGSAKSHAGKY